MGQFRPSVHLLDTAHKQAIFEEAKLILHTLGVYIENTACLDLFKAQGISIQKQRVYIPPDIVTKCLATVPSEITLYDREGKYAFTMRADEVHYDPGSAAINFLDETTGHIRAPLSADFIRFSQVVDHLQYIHAQSTAIVYQDVPSDAQDWHRLFVALSHCSKPVVTGTFRKASFSIMHELLLACRTSEKDLKAKPLAIFDACPSPPLKWSDLTTQSVIDAALAGIPSEFVSMPLSGATAPITLIGSITQHCAETLAGVIIGQLAHPGCPLIWGGSPAVFDMKYGTTPMAAIETMMINLGNVEMGKFLHLPTHAYMTLSDSKIPDAQAGFEAGMGALLAGLAGINMISGAGMLDFESTQSLEKLILDHEIIGQVYRFIRGIDEYGFPFAAEILKDYDETQSLLAHPSTVQLFRKELNIPTPIIDRMQRDLWIKAGSNSARHRAHDEIAKYLRKSPRIPLDPRLASEFMKITQHNLPNMPNIMK